MGRPGRTLLLIAVMAIVCVAALMGLANRYGKVLEQRAQHRPARRHPTSAVATLRPAVPPREAAAPAASPEEQAQSFVDRFLAVRLEMRAALDATAGAGPAERLATLDHVRERALEAHALGLAEYRQVRALWRGWRAAGSAPTPAFTAAFAARFDELDAADLGSMEAND